MPPLPSCAKFVPLLKSHPHTHTHTHTHSTPCKSVSRRARARLYTHIRVQYKSESGGPLPCSGARPSLPVPIRVHPARLSRMGSRRPATPAASPGLAEVRGEGWRRRPPRAGASTRLPPPPASGSRETLGIQIATLRPRPPTGSATQSGAAAKRSAAARPKGSSSSSAARSAASPPAPHPPAALPADDA